jgi:N-methylhydantoinase B
MDAQSALDRIRLQVIWDRLIAIVEEQAQVLMKTAFSNVVREAGDLSAGIFNAQGDMLAQAVTGTPGHVNAMAQSVRHFLSRFPAEGMSSGDVFVTNDPWLGTGHLHDFTMVTPVLRDDALLGLFASTCHVLDIGGMGFGPDGREIFEEGLNIPIMHFARRGELNQVMLEILRANVRQPLSVEGDLHSLAASNERGRRRLLELLDEYGLSSLDIVGQWILTRSREAMLRDIRRLKPARHRHRMLVEDHKGNIELAAEVDISHDGIRVDLEGTSGSVPHGINVPLPYTTAYASFGIRCLVGASIPNNAGSLGAVTVTAPKGCILNAQWPSPVSARGMIGQLLPDLIFGCLFKSLPDRTPAESSSCLWGPVLSGRNADNSRYSLVGVHAGGMGARWNADGLSATSYPSGVRCTPVEVTEATSPIIVWRRELSPDTGGAGEFRGGLGQVMEYGHADGMPFLFNAMYQRTRHAPKGRLKGRKGSLGRVTSSSGKRLRGQGRQQILRGEHLILHSPGGGGYGDPGLRDPSLVRRDVIDGLVSVGAAREEYRVSIDELGTIDERETAILRGKAMPDA